MCATSTVLIVRAGVFRLEKVNFSTMAASLEVLALSNVSVTFADWHLCTSIDYSVEAHRVGLQAPPGSCAQK